jgi:hypothetical protein
MGPGKAEGDGKGLERRGGLRALRPASLAYKVLGLATAVRICPRLYLSPIMFSGFQLMVEVAIQREAAEGKCLRLV